MEFGGGYCLGFFKNTEFSLEVMELNHILCAAVGCFAVNDLLWSISDSWKEERTGFADGERGSERR